MKLSLHYARATVCAMLALPILATAVYPATLYAQSSGTISGTVLDPRGVPLPGASVSVKNDVTGDIQKKTSDGTGKYSVAGLTAGKYTVQVDAPGFNTAQKLGIQLAAGASAQIPVTLELGNVSEQVTVEASEANSVAAAMAPMDALLEETSPRTEITQAFIQNFTAPSADYGEIVAMAPGTFTTNGNGIGLGQSKTFFRGFPDGDYDIDYDGIPFYDTNSPTHHSWVFFPSQWIGGVDFDRSPGTASTTGPTPFGGSIHLLSRDLSPVQNIRGGFSYASFNTKLYDASYDTGAFGPGHKLSLSVDVHHLSADGYQTFNYQKRSAGEIKMQYRLSDKTSITGFSGVVRLDANTPNFNPTRCQMYGAGATYTCTGALAPFAGSGLNFYLTDNSDPYNWLDYQYNRYHIPTDFEYIGFKTELAHAITIDVKPYTYDYDNGELYANNAPLIDGATSINGSSTYLGVAVKPCDKPVVTAGTAALPSGTSIEPCGVDKYNSYRKYGETSTISQVSKFGILRTGMWYEWARTDRHQYPTDPVSGFKDQVFPNFAEQFWNNSFQPFVEYQFNVGNKLKVTPGVKFAYNTISTKQYADDGKTIGPLALSFAAANPNAFVSNSGNYSAWLPSIDFNYRVRTNWSAYGQLSTGTIVPPSNVYDYNQTVSAGNPTPHLGTAPKQQRSTTYQFGTVVKLKRLTMDADFYHIRFQNSYSVFTDQTTDTQNFYLQPASITKGFEAEGNIYIGKGLSAYLNGTVGRAYYTGNVYQACVAGATCTASTPALTETAPSGLWVADTPTDTEAEGVTYQNHGFDFGMFNKRVGTLHKDSGSYHNAFAIDPYNVTNIFFNYTIRSGSHFDQTKIKLSFNNLFNQQNITSVSGLSKAVPLPPIAANGTTYVDAFNIVGPVAPGGADSVSVVPARSISIGVTFGWSPKR
jgi:iron complex outermembrane recepter protein